MKQYYAFSAKAISAILVLVISLTDISAQPIYNASATEHQPVYKLQATASGNHIIISWNFKALQQPGTDAELERSIDNGDFKTICYIMSPAPDAAEAAVCSYKDKQANLAARQNITYRLKQTDRNGNITYSELAAVRP